MTGGSGRDSTAWTMPVATRKQGGVHVAERNVEIAKGKTAAPALPPRTGASRTADLGPAMDEEDNSVRALGSLSHSTRSMRTKDAGGFSQRHCV